MLGVFDLDNSSILGIGSYSPNISTFISLIVQRLFLQKEVICIME